MSVRVIARLDIKGPNLVKGIQLEGLRVLGRPQEYARHYYESGVDELLFMDVVASLYGRNNILDLISETSRETFIPLTVGGGIRSVADIQAVLRAGADKVALNTAAVANPGLIREAAATFGSSTIVVSIEAMRTGPGKYEAFTDNGREPTKHDVTEWAREVAEHGAGEILLTSIDREGTGRGYDLELTRAVAEAVPIPVIACGGAGRPADVVQVIQKGRADGVAMASILHYDAARRGVAAPSKAEGNTSYLSSGAQFSLVEAGGVPVVKRALIDAGIKVRPPQEDTLHG